MNTLVLERRTTSHRHDVQSERTLTDSSYNLFFGQAFGIFEIFFHEGFVLLSSDFEHLAAPFFALILHIGGNFFHVVFSTHGLIVPQDSLHLDQVNNTLEVFFSTNGHCDNTGSCTEYILHLANHLEEVSTRTVHLVYITDTGNIVLVSLTPYSFRLRFNATYSTVSCHSTVEYTERTLYLSGKSTCPGVSIRLNLYCLPFQVQ